MWNTDLTEACELDNLLLNAAVTVHSAEARKVGTCHNMFSNPKSFAGRNSRYSCTPPHRRLVAH